MHRNGRARGWIGWALGVLAALTLVIAVPQHVLDRDEDGGPVAEALVHGHAHTVMDHGQPGHDCAAHCAAHVMSDAPAPFVLAQHPPRPLVWAAIEQQRSRAGPSRTFEKPPKA
jgi:hypothetical protein